MQLQSAGRAPVGPVVVLSALALVLLGTWLVPKWGSGERPADGAGRGPVAPAALGVAQPAGAEPTAGERVVGLGHLSETARRADALAAALPPAIRGIVAPRAGLDFASVRCALVPSQSSAGGTPLWGDRHRERAFAERPEPLFTTQPNLEGEFLFPVDRGHWTLLVDSPGWARWIEGGLEPGAFRLVELDRAVPLEVRVRTPEGEAIEGAWVELCYDAIGQLEPLAWATSDARGTAHLTARPGHYTLWAGHGDHLAASMAVNLEASEVGIRVELELGRGWALGGTVNTAEGGAPPVGTTVRVEVGLDFRSPTSFPVELDGRWRTGHLFRAGQTIDVAVLAPGYGEVRVERNLPAPAAEIPLEIDLVLGARERSARGVAVDSQGAPVADVRVFLQALIDLPPPSRSIRMPLDMDPNDRPDIRHEATLSQVSKNRPAARTDEEGRFEVVGLDPGRPYCVSLISDLHQNRMVWVYPGLPGSVEELGSVVMPAGARFFGRIVTAQGLPLEHLSIHTVWRNVRRIVAGQVYEASLPTTYRGAFDTVTNAFGEFEIAPLPGGGFFLLVQGQLLGPWEVAEGESHGPVTITVERDARRTPVPMATLAGTVTGADGSPVPRAWMRVVRAGVEPQGAALPLALGPVDPNGRFHFEVPAPGPFRVEAADLAGHLGHAFLAVESSESDAALRLVLPLRAAPPASLTGQVLDPQGRPVPSLALELLLSATHTGCACVRWPASTDADGRFDFGPTLEGTHQLFLRDPSGRHPGRSLPVRPRAEPWEIWLDG